MSKCALKLALAIADPWHPGAMHACVPFGAANTRKMHCWTRFTASIGLGGFGYVLVAPTVASNTPVAYASNNLFNFTDTRVLSAANTLYPGVVRINLGQVPYSAAQFVGGHGECTMCSRVVSVGIRMRYIGTNLNMSGLVFVLREATHGSVQFRNQTVGATQSWGTFKDAIIEANNRSWHTVLDFAHDDTEKTITGVGDLGANITTTIYPYCKGQTGYFDPIANATFTDTVNGVPVGVPTLGLIYTGVIGEQVEIEISQHVEYYGAAADQDSTATPADNAGMEQVYAAANKTVFARQAASHKTGWKLMTQELKLGVKDLESVAVNDAESAAAALI
jgi:hypothetical protein